MIRLEIPAPARQAELLEVRDHITVSRTASRVVLGAMNDMVRLSGVYLDMGASLPELNQYLPTVLFSPLKMSTPARVTRALFASPESAMR